MGVLVPRHAPIRLRRDRRTAKNTSVQPRRFLSTPIYESNRRNRLSSIRSKVPAAHTMSQMVGFPTLSRRFRPRPHFSGHISARVPSQNTNRWKAVSLWSGSPICLAAFATWPTLGGDGVALCTSGKLNLGAHRQVLGRVFFFAFRISRNSPVFGRFLAQDEVRKHSGMGQDALRNGSGIPANGWFLHHGEASGALRTADRRRAGLGPRTTARPRASSPFHPHRGHSPCFCHWAAILCIHLLISEYSKLRAKAGCPGNFSSEPVRQPAPCA